LLLDCTNPLLYFAPAPLTTRHQAVASPHQHLSFDLIIVLSNLVITPLPRMPPIDPADVRAKARRKLGLSCELQQTRNVPPHPRHGSTGYPVFYNSKIGKMDCP
jgi:hypothetical protein